MTFRRCFALAALLGALMMGTNTAHAAIQFSFASTTSPAVTSFSPPLNGSTVTFGPGVGTGLTSPTGVVLANITDTSTTVAPGSDTTVINYVVSVAITNNPTSSGANSGTLGTSTITVAGTLTVTGNNSSQFNGGNVFGTIGNNGVLIGGVNYTLSGLAFVSPQISPAALGSIGATITGSFPNPVPEPASVVMLGSGLFGVIGLGLRRRIRKT